MTSEQNEPSQATWRRLYDAAIAFKEQACWNWMQDTDIFGVKDPVSGEIGYCCVLGAAGEVFGMTVYRGTEGLNVYLEMASREMGGWNPDFLFVQRCLMADFHDRNELDGTDRDVIRSLGLKFRGPNAWPQFRSYLPGYYPWHLSEAEASFLASALEQALDVCLRCRDNPNLLRSPSGKGYLVRTAVQKESQSVWQDEWLEPERVEPKAFCFEPLDEVRLARIKEVASSSNQVWEGDFFHMNAPIKEGERPFYPRLFIWADAGSGLLLSQEMNHPKDPITPLRDSLIKLLQEKKAFPREIRLRKEEAVELLLPLAEHLGIKLVKTRSLRAIDLFRRSLSDRFGSVP